MVAVPTAWLLQAVDAAGLLLAAWVWYQLFLLALALSPPCPSKRAALRAGAALFSDVAAESALQRLAAVVRKYYEASRKIFSPAGGSGGLQDEDSRQNSSGPASTDLPEFQPQEQEQHDDLATEGCSAQLTTGARDTTSSGSTHGMSSEEELAVSESSPEVGSAPSPSSRIPADANVSPSSTGAPFGVPPSLPPDGVPMAEVGEMELPESSELRETVEKDLVVDETVEEVQDPPSPGDVGSASGTSENLAEGATDAIENFGEGGREEPGDGAQVEAVRSQSTEVETSIDQVELECIDLTPVEASPSQREGAPPEAAAPQTPPRRFVPRKREQMENTQVEDWRPSLRAASQASRLDPPLDAGRRPGYSFYKTPERPRYGSA